MICNLCPRKCGTDRTVKIGYCGTGKGIKIARAALHHWEEPCISGKNGSGAVFFSGCTLHCIYCQNKEISGGSAGTETDIHRLAGIFSDLQEQGAHNINLVTGDHYIPEIREAILEARSNGFDLPFIFNCSGYETVESLKLLEGLIDVYLPDFKYAENSLAKSLSNAEDYPETAKRAIEEMIRQQPRCVFDRDNMIKKGVIIRNLLLPKHVMNSKKILRYLHEAYGDTVYISIMSQYTPVSGLPDTFPELKRRVTAAEYERLTDYAIKLGIEKAFIQERSAADKGFIPCFDNTGVY